MFAPQKPKKHQGYSLGIFFGSQIKVLLEGAHHFKPVVHTFRNFSSLEWRPFHQDFGCDIRKFRTSFLRDLKKNRNRISSTSIPKQSAESTSAMLQRAGPRRNLDDAHRGTRKGIINRNNVSEGKAISIAIHNRGCSPPLGLPP